MSWREFLQQFLNQFDTLPDRLGGHIRLSLAAMAVGMLISIPLGIWAARRPRAETICLSLASVVQTIPSLALLALMVFAFHTIGWVPAWLALVLYSVLPMLRNTVTGIQGVDPAAIEAAKGIGMSPGQTLVSVELPLALPTIVSGVRTASVWVVGAATLAQPVGATSLGSYIFVGLQTLNFAAILFGCIFSALLAMAFDWLLHGMEQAAKKRSIGLAVLLAFLLLLVASSPWLMSLQNRAAGSVKAVDLTTNTDEGINTPLVVGSKNFAESYVLMEVVKRRLEQQGFEVRTRGGLGSGFMFEALVNGELDACIDYTGTIWANQMKMSETTNAVEMLVDVATFMKNQYGIISLGSMGFSNDYVFMMRPEDAERLNIKDLHDLAREADGLKFVMDIEFYDRPERLSVQGIYGLEMKQRRSMEPTLMYGAIENKSADVVIAFRTDGRTVNLMEIEDPLTALPPYDGVLLVSPRLAKSARGMRALRPLIQAIDSQTMRAGNARVEVEKKSIEDTAEWLLDQLFGREE